MIYDWYLALGQTATAEGIRKNRKMLFIYLGLAIMMCGIGLANLLVSKDMPPIFGLAVVIIGIGVSSMVAQ